MWDLKSKELAARRRLYEFVWCSNVDGKDVMKNHFLAIHCEVMMIVIGPRDQHIHHHPSSIHHLSDLLYIIHSFSWGEHALRINDDLQWFLCCCRYFHWNGHRNWCYSGAEWDGHVWVGGPKFAFTLPRKGEKDRKGMVLSFKSFNWDWPRTQEPKNLNFCHSKPSKTFPHRRMPCSLPLTTRTGTCVAMCCNVQIMDVGKVARSKHLCSRSSMTSETC